MTGRRVATHQIPVTHLCKGTPDADCMERSAVFVEAVETGQGGARRLLVEVCLGCAPVWEARVDAQENGPA